MTKAKLIFDLSEPDDRMAHLAAVKSGEMAIVLWEITHNLKKNCHLKAENSQGKLDSCDVVELVFQEIYNLLDENNIVIDELTC